MAEKEYIEREAIIRKLNEIGGCDASDEWDKVWDMAIDTAVKAVERLPVADVSPVKHGHIVWKEYHKGGIRRRKCLQEIKSVYIEQQMPCKHIAIIDERYLSKDPYCSECGKLLGEFLNYCVNCGAKMGGEVE